MVKVAVLFKVKNFANTVEIFHKFINRITLPYYGEV